jgi:hypothetical protein
MSINFENFYSKKEEPYKSCLLSLRDIILNHDDFVNETAKYGMPCFCFHGKAFCYLWTDKKSFEPYILFVEGNQLDHPMLEIGKRSRMKILRIDPMKDLQMDTLCLLLNQAIALCGK